MASTGLNIGPHPLTPENIDYYVRSRGPGSYVLSRGNDAGKFVVHYTGRSDEDLKARLKAHASNGLYARFKCDFTVSAKAAFQRECRIFHDFGGISKLDNKIHPDRPNGSGWECPICTIFD